MSISRIGVIINTKHTSLLSLVNALAKHPHKKTQNSPGGWWIGGGPGGGKEGQACEEEEGVDHGLDHGERADKGCGAKAGLDHGAIACMKHPADDYTMQDLVATVDPAGIGTTRVELVVVIFTKAAQITLWTHGGTKARAVLLKFCERTLWS